LRWSIRLRPPPVLNSFARWRALPRICNIGEGFSTSHAQEFRARKLDLLVSPDPMEELDGVVRYPLMTEPFLLIAPDTELMAGQQAVDVRQLNSALPIIRYSNRSAAGSRIDRYLLERDIKLRQRIEVETSEVMCGLVASGMGCPAKKLDNKFDNGLRPVN